MTAGPPTRQDPEEMLWCLALAVLRGHAFVESAEVRRLDDYSDRPRWGAGWRGTQATVDLRVVAGRDELRIDDARQLRLAVATLLVARLGMRLAPEATSDGPTPVAPVAAPPAAPPAPPGPGEPDDSSTRFGLLELD